MLHLNMASEIIFPGRLLRTIRTAEWLLASVCHDMPGQVARDPKGLAAIRTTVLVLWTEATNLEKIQTGASVQGDHVTPVYVRFYIEFLHITPSQ